ncbi:hypothetical protein JOQ06_004525 [Pogonophryne albipinna]|uniref:Uncharacterized protein n=1 Tax=Pogonophryne albipinna TaxID=1090488 RepID=A0AAD6FCQ2_9TELE|nr:hypothetical protein JOQ06_004525 [Pogonophryne albipinna]
MSLSKSLKRKVEVENRSFNEEWTDKYAFIMPSFSKAKPVCLICNEMVAVPKEYNLRRHHLTKHTTFSQSYPEKSEARRIIMSTLKAGYARATGIITRTSTEQERATSASLQAVWVLTKNNKAFATSGVFKECMVAVLEELATDKSMDRIVASVKQVPLSASTTARRVHVLSEDVQQLVLDEVKKAEHISVAIDESTDTTDISQLSVFVRYFDGKDFKEELLALIPLEGNTTGEIIFEKVEELFKKHGLLLQKVNLIVTDGAPAMAGKNRGMVSRFKNVAPKTNALHCLIHQSVLCAKLSGDLKDVMDKTMKIINFIRGNSSTQHRLFRKFVLESDATHDDLLFHNDVRWLSKGKALERFIELRDQVVEFVKQSKSKGAADYLCIMQDKTYMSNVAFLADIFSHLNALNLQLQGKEKSVVNLVEKLDAFRRKLDLFNTDLISGKLLHFNTLKTVGESNVTRNMKQFMTQLRENFSTRFDDFAITRDVLEFVRDPFSISLVGEFSANAKKLLQLDEVAIQIQLIDMRQSPARCKLLSGSLEDCLRISLTAVKPDIKRLVSEGKCNFSH